MKNLLLLNLGGLMRQNAKDYLTAAELLACVPEMRSLANIDGYDELLLPAAELGSKEWQSIAKVIADNYAHYDGFVLTLGVDGISYLALALSYMLRNLGKSVVLTGAQIAYGEAGSDLRTNLQLAFSFALGTLPGVYVAFGNKVILGKHIKQVFGRHVNAFDSVGRAPVVLFTKQGMQKSLPSAEVEGAFSLMAQLDPRVRVITALPGAEPSALTEAIEAGMRGIVLVLYGTYGLPLKGGAWLKAVKAALRQGIRIEAISSSTFGAPPLDATALGRSLAEIGVRSSAYSVEGAAVKLMWEGANL